MLITVLKSKIHRATVTGADIEYEGSISIDSELLELAGIAVYEQVHVANLTNGARLITYAIDAPRGSKDVIINGAAAKLVEAGDTVIIMAYQVFDNAAGAPDAPSVVRLGKDNIVLGFNGGSQGC